MKDHGLEFSGLAANLWMHKLISVPDSGPYIAEFAKNLFFAEDLGIDCIRVDTLEPPDVFEKTGTDPKVGRQRVVKAWDLCSKLAASRGIRVAWEFEPGFAFNKPSEILSLVDEVRALGNPNFGVMYDTCHAHMCAAVGARQPGAQGSPQRGALELLQKLRGKDHACPSDRLGRDVARQRDQHARAFRQRGAELGPVDSRDRQGRRAFGLVVHRSVFLARGVGGYRGRQTVPRSDAEEIRGIVCLRGARPPSVRCSEPC